MSEKLEPGDIRFMIRMDDDNKEITLTVQSAIPLTSEDFKEILLLYVEDPDFKQVGGEILEEHCGETH